MPNTKDAQPDNRGIFALFKGSSGSGKSVGALSFCDPDNDGSRPGYVFDNDRKMPNISLKHFPQKSIDYDCFDNIFSHADKLNEFFAYCPYETIIEDSLTSLVVNVLNSVGEIKGEKAMDMLRKLQATRGGKQQIELMGIDYYNAETNFIERYWLDALKSLWARPGNPKNVIVIAHVMTTDSAPDLKSKIVTQTSAIVTAGRKVASYIPTQFDDAWHFAHERDMEGGYVRRLVLTENVGMDSAKTSFRLPYKIDFTGTPPSYKDGNLCEKFQKIIKGDISL